MESYFFQDEKSGLILANTGQPWKGKGDALKRTAEFALVRADPKALVAVRDLLHQRRRWPEHLDDPRGPRYEHRKAEGFLSMTRDPYIMYYVAEYFVGNPRNIGPLNMPVYCKRPHVEAWQEYLYAGSSLSKRWYERFQLLSLHLAHEWPFQDDNWIRPLPQFAVYLDAWMAWTAQSERIQRALLPYVPHWNYLVKQLINHPLKHLDEAFIKIYAPRKGYQWQEERSLNTGLLPAGQFFYHDLEMLIWVYQANKNLMR